MTIIMNSTSILQYISKALDFYINFDSVILLLEFLMVVLKVMVTNFRAIYNIEEL